MKDEEWEQLVMKIRNSPPPMRLFGWWWRTPAPERALVNTDVVIDNQGPKIEVVETEGCKEEKQRILDRFKASSSLNDWNPRRR